jgi:hypothetical protein
MMTTGLVGEAYAKILELGAALGAKRIDLLPGCWSRDFGPGWRVAVNGHDTPTDHDGASIPPCEAFVWWQGWPAGSIGLHGGIIAAGEVANEAAFIRALDAEIEAVTGRPPRAMGGGEAKSEAPATAADPAADLIPDLFEGLPEIFKACVERELLGKTDIRTPWQEDGRIFATDGRILVTVPAVGPLADYPGPAPDRKVPKGVPGHFAGWTAAGYEADPVELPAESDGRPIAEWTPCEECYGVGEVVMTNVLRTSSSSCECEDCDGSGKVPTRRAIDLGGVYLMEYYVALLRRHGARVFLPIRPTEQTPVRIEGEGWSGFLMGMSCGKNP